MNTPLEKDEIRDNCGFYSKRVFSKSQKNRSKKKVRTRENSKSK